MEHIKEAFREKNYTSPKSRWIREMIHQGYSPSIDLITEVNSDGNGAEKAYIRFFKKKGIPLVNQTVGGSNTTEVARQKMRDAHKGKKHAHWVCAKIKHGMIERQRKIHIKSNNPLIKEMCLFYRDNSKFARSHGVNMSCWDC